MFANEQPTPTDLKREAVEFAEYLRINEWAFAIDSGDDWVKINEENELVFKTSVELYDLFKAEKP